MRLAGPTAGIALLQTTCRRLAAGERSIDLSEQPGVQLVGLTSVVFRRGAVAGWLRLRGQDRLEVIFDGNAEQWDTRAQLLDPLVEQPLRPAFQYLDYDRTGDAAIVAELII